MNVYKYMPPSLSLSLPLSPGGPDLRLLLPLTAGTSLSLFVRPPSLPPSLPRYVARLLYAFVRVCSCVCVFGGGGLACVRARMCAAGGRRHI